MKLCCVVLCCVIISIFRGRIDDNRTDTIMNIKICNHRGLKMTSVNPFIFNDVVDTCRCFLLSIDNVNISWPMYAHVRVPQK